MSLFGTNTKELTKKCFLVIYLNVVHYEKNGGGTTISFYNYFWQLLPDMTVFESSDSNAELLLVPQYYIFIQLTGKVSLLHHFLKLEFLCTCVLVSKSGKFAKI